MSSRDRDASQSWPYGGDENNFGEETRKEMNTIFVFDIDGTLVSTGGAGRRAICAGVASVVGCSAHEVPCEFSFAGMTDRAIMRRVLKACGHRCRREAIDAAICAYVDRLVGEVATSTGYRVFDGVEEMLERLAVRPGVALGLGTGNARRGARIKLRRAGLNEYFDFGGYGGEVEKRSEVIRLAIERGARKMGQQPGGCRAVVIGDTPADVAAAEANDAQCLAVATGRPPRSALEACRPTWLVDSLEWRETGPVFDEIFGR